MQRTQTLFTNGSCFYICTKSLKERILFNNDEEYEFYLRKIKEIKKAEGIFIFAFCLLSNEVHLVLKPDSKSKFRSFMNKLNRSYTRYIQDKCTKNGRIWSGKYNVLCLQKSSELFSSIKYLEMLPVYKGLSQTPVEYPWSSCIHRVLSEESSVIDRLFFDRKTDLTSVREIMYRDGIW